MPQILLAIGLGVLVIAIVGLCGVLRDSGCLLTLVSIIFLKLYIGNKLLYLYNIILQFSILLTIVLIGELALSGFIYHMHGEIEKYALNQMNTSISVYNKTGQEASTEAWNLLQSDVN